MRSARIARITFALAAITLLTVGCGEREIAPTAPEGAVAAHPDHANAAAAGSEVNRWLADLRRTVARLHRGEDAAAAAGWDFEITGCLEQPGAGGMGWHYANTSLIDGTPEALSPELLVYAPSRNGGKKLVAVEFIVPFDAWTDEAPPSLHGVDFHRNEGFGLWVLHAWIFEHNPDGMFADWNPRIGCPTD